MKVIINNTVVIFNYQNELYENMPLGKKEIEQITFSLKSGSLSGFTVDEVDETMPELNIVGSWHLK